MKEKKGISCDEKDRERIACCDPDEKTLGLQIEKDGVVWNTDPKKAPELIFEEGMYHFLDAEEISHEIFHPVLDTGFEAVMRDLREHRTRLRRSSGSKTWMRRSGWNGFHSVRKDSSEKVPGQRRWSL